MSDKKHTIWDTIFGLRFNQQFAALLYKNVLVAWRSRRATLIRMLAPFFFLILALIVKAGIESDSQKRQAYADTSVGQATTIGYIPDCHQDLYIADKPCIDFIYTPVGNPDVEAIIAGVKSNNVPVLPDNKVLGLATRADANAYMLANPESCLGAVHFYNDTTTGALDYIIQSNTTSKYFKGYFQDINEFFQLPIMSAVQRETTKLLLTQAGQQSLANSLTWAPRMVTFPHPSLDTNSLVGSVLGPFIFAAVMFGFVAQMGSLVTEKELGLRQALRNMGMRVAPYWASWAMFDALFALIVAILINIFGMIMQFRFFLKNDFGLMLLFWWLFQLAMSALAYLLSVFLKKGQAAVYTGFFIFLVGWIFQVVVIFGVPYSPTYYFDNGAGYAFFWVFTILPWNPLAKGVVDMGLATPDNVGPGIRWSQRDSYCRYIPNVADQPPVDPKQEYVDFDCVLSINWCYIAFIVQYLVFLTLAVYLDHVVPNEVGVSRPPWYFLTPSYWLGTRQVAGKALKQVQQQQSRRTRDGVPAPVEMDEDVRREEERMQSLMGHRTGVAGELAAEDAGRKRNAVELFGLSKRFRNRNLCCGGAPDFWAIAGSWFAIEENQLFCLLGPNGAGKTTTINCLTGVLPLSGGNALVYGEAISSEGGMDRVRSMMGVCPQFDILWGELTGIEHLTIYGHVKGIKARNVATEAAELLEKVKLTYARNQPSGSYSGGMKRRLSVAIALLGDPKIVYLDEPTTGMDPISRRYVWDIIQESKAGRAIVLTTHSMEEADILGDRIAIMARGRLRALGNSTRLKQKFGAGYQISVSTMSARGSTANLSALAERQSGVKAYFQAGLGLAPVEESRAYVTYLVQRTREEELIAFLQRLEGDKESLGVTDLQIGLTSLEEVFLTIARKAEVEAAQQSGRADVEHLLEDGSTIKVPLGADHAVHPTTGLRHRVRWAQDDQGRLAVSSCVPDGQGPQLQQLGPQQAPGAGLNGLHKDVELTPLPDVK